MYQLMRTVACTVALAKGASWRVVLAGTSQSLAKDAALIADFRALFRAEAAAAITVVDYGTVADALVHSSNDLAESLGRFMQQRLAATR
jgi:hypothetical protein